MEEIKSFLVEIGFGKNEAEVYLNLLRYGSSTVLEISNSTKLHRSNIYDALRNLTARGLVYEIIGQTTKTFAARKIESLMNYFEQKKIELTQLISEKSFGERAPDAKIKVSKGTFALKEALYGLLETKMPIEGYGIPKKASTTIGRALLSEFHKERIKKGIPMKHIYNSDSVRRAQLLNKMPLTEARVLPKKYDSFATTNISGNKITIFTWGEEINVIEVEDESLALPYKNYFEILWSRAKKP